MASTKQRSPTRRQSRSTSSAHTWKRTFARGAWSKPYDYAAASTKHLVQLSAGCRSSWSKRSSAISLEPLGKKLLSAGFPSSNAFKQTCSIDPDLEYSDDESGVPSDDDEPCRQHAEHARKWLAKFTPAAAGKRNILNMLRGALLADFDLDVWTTFVRREGSGSFGDPRQTTVAYLTLSNACTTSARWGVDSREDGIDADDPDDGGLVTIADQYESGFGIPVDHLEALSEKSVKKFYSRHANPRSGGLC